MEGKRQSRLQFIVFVCLAVGLLLSGTAQATPRLALQFSLVEYSWPAGRTGTLQIYIPDSPSPFGSIPGFQIYDTGLWSVTSWDSLGGCNTSFLAGGRQEGWVLGPVTDPAAVRSMHPTAVGYFAVGTGMFGDTGYANRYSCYGSPTAEPWSILALFILPQSSYIPGQGYHIGDVWYATEYNSSGNWYYVFSPNPL